MKMSGQAMSFAISVQHCFDHVFAAATELLKICAVAIGQKENFLAIHTPARTPPFGSCITQVSTEARSRSDGRRSTQRLRINYFFVSTRCRRLTNIGLKQNMARLPSSRRCRHCKRWRHAGNMVQRLVSFNETSCVAQNKRNRPVFNRVFYGSRR